MSVFYDEGFYVCRVTQQGHGESKAGNPMITIGVEPTHVISKGPDGAEELCPVTQAYERTVRLVIANDEQKEYALLKLRYAGFVGDSFSKLNLVGEDVRCECKHQDGTGDHAGKTFENWDLMLPPRERTELIPIDGAAARKLDALFGRRLKEGAKDAVANAARGEESQESFDDVPF